MIRPSTRLPRVGAAAPRLTRPAEARLGCSAPMPLITPNMTAIHGPKSGPGESTAAIANAGSSDSFSAASSSVLKGLYQLARLANV